MYYFIVNIASRTGGAREAWRALEGELRRRGVPYQAFFTKYPGHAGELARRLTARPGEVPLVAVGGDGTANEVVNGIQDFKRVRFGYIPIGSGNDLGRGLGLPQGPLPALKAILESKELHAMDLGKVSWGRKLEESAYFNISSGIGMDAEVCRRVNASGIKVFLNRLHLGRLSYFIQTILALVDMRVVRARVQFDGGEKKRVRGLICMAAMNHRFEGGGLPMAPNASDQDGKLSVCYIYGISRLKALLPLAALARGKHLGFPGIGVVDCASCELWLESALAGHTDGEDLGDLVHLRYECLPGALQVME